MYKVARRERYGATARSLELSPSAVLPLHSPRPSRAACIQSEVWVGIMTKRRESLQVQITTRLFKAVIIL
ncbi:hypothetical protein BDN71DRAFT_1458271 [Pleurotus eryngii]|uniref:Uncharacterized protein n=1 Tax=Pleurotus eryngii TaxID=5323 RepID=A0A9P5ZKV6_PLEER|nr:hypothetical protein BDN71DRAFT_1458271 [Pleurotus eryngii]